MADKLTGVKVLAGVSLLAHLVLGAVIMGTDMLDNSIDNAGTGSTGSTGATGTTLENDKYLIGSFSIVSGLASGIVLYQAIQNTIDVEKLNVYLVLIVLSVLVTLLLFVVPASINDKAIYYPVLQGLLSVGLGGYALMPKSM